MEQARTSSGRKWLLWSTGVLCALVALGFIGRHFAVEKLREEVTRALGPNAEIASIETSFTGVTINGIRIRASQGWPADEELSARRVTVRPDWGALLSRNIRIADIEIEGAYLSLLRRKNGKLALLPSLLEQPGKTAPNTPSPDAKDKPDAAAAIPEVTIARVRLVEAAVDFFDASVRQPAHKLRLEQTSVTLGTLRLPALSGQTDIEIEGVIKGVRQDGKLALKGWAEIATRDSDIQARLNSVDLVAFQPYLIKAAETGVKKGTLDLNMKSVVKRNRLHAPGRVTLSGLELSTGGTFMGMPRETVVRMLKDKKGQITADFVLEGNIDDPKFSLNEKFLTQVGAATANVLGISLEGLAKGIGGAGGSAVSGIGSAVGKLFGGEQKK